MFQIPLLIFAFLYHLHLPFQYIIDSFEFHAELTRYVGNYDKFLEGYQAKKAQLEAAYKRQQQTISELKDFVARNKSRVATRNI